MGLLIYSYATGTFSSRQIERNSYDSVPVRYLCGDTHPDHDTICEFRRRNGELFAHSFAQVIEMAARSGVLKLGGITVAIDGTKEKGDRHLFLRPERGHASQMSALTQLFKPSKQPRLCSDTAFFADALKSHP